MTTEWTKTPKTYEDAIGLAEDWDQVADNEILDELQYLFLRDKAAHYRELADRLPHRVADSPASR